MNAPRVDRWGDPIEDDDNLRVHGPTGRTRDEIHHDRITELRHILRDARDRRNTPNATPPKKETST